MRFKVSRLFGVTAWLSISCSLWAAQSGLISREEALTAAYPGAVVEAEQVFLTVEQTQRISELAVDLESALVARYVARRAGEVVGRAYVDTHVVRTRRESLLIALGPDGTVRRIEVTVFQEPREYTAPEPWRRQFEKQPLSDDLALQREIRSIAGATLTAQAMTAAVRRVLAIDRVLETED